MGSQPRHYQASLAIGDRISTATAAGVGSHRSALTAMLYEHGIAVEMTSFHQFPVGDETATFIRGSNGARDEWAMGTDEDATSRRYGSSLARIGC